MAQMACEAGAEWLVLALPEGTEGLRDELEQIVTLCRDGGVIVTADNVEVARELGLHGVFVDGAETSAVRLREELGAEAIIGTIIRSSDSAPALQRADIDYVALRPEEVDAAAVIAGIRAAECQIPVVAYVPAMKVDADAAAAYMAQGFSGICAGTRFFDGADPVAEIEQLLNAIR
ncbi:MAG: thiamine phosphate synthase [Muribaculaceae bacterium]|nr:thiamine phosphate synthase [Muribaculaceae bacterium]